MNIDKERIRKLLYEIKKEAEDLKDFIEEKNESEILSDNKILKSIKYTLIQLAEAISLVLQHILAKKYGEPVKGYIDTIKRAYEKGIISEKLYNNLYPFFVFRNTLIHRYWTVDDKELLKNCKKGYKDFFVFIEEIERLFLK